MPLPEFPLPLLPLPPPELPLPLLPPVPVEPPPLLLFPEVTPLPADALAVLVPLLALDVVLVIVPFPVAPFALALADALADPIADATAEATELLPLPEPFALLDAPPLLQTEAVSLPREFLTLAPMPPWARPWVAVCMFSLTSPIAVPM